MKKDKTKHLSHWVKNKYVPSLSSFYKILKLYHLKGKAPERWYIGLGAAPIIFVDAVKDLASSASMGMVTENAEIRIILEDVALKPAEERG